VDNYQQVNTLAVGVVTRLLYAQLSKLHNPHPTAKQF